MEKIKNFIPLNFELLSNPINWVIVTLMVLVAGMALAHIFKSPTGNDNPNANEIRNSQN
jgi:hypothetical protein